MGSSQYVSDSRPVQLILCLRFIALPARHLYRIHFPEAPVTGFTPFHPYCPFFWVSCCLQKRIAASASPLSPLSSQSPSSYMRNYVYVYLHAVASLCVMLLYSRCTIIIRIVPCMLYAYLPRNYKRNRMRIEPLSLMCVHPCASMLCARSHDCQREARARLKVGGSMR